MLLPTLLRISQMMAAVGTQWAVRLADIPRPGPPELKAGAVLVAGRLIRNEQVVGSNPTGGSNLLLSCSR